MMRKNFTISEAEVIILKQIQTENSFLENDSAALRFALSEYVKLKKMEETVMQENQEMLSELKILKSIMKSIESENDCFFDAINTMLIEAGTQICYPVAYMESPVITKSKQYRKEKLAELKQKKDYKLAKIGK